MKVKILASVGIAVVIFLAVTLFRGCDKPKQDDELKQQIDSLKTIIAAKDIEIKKLDEIITYYAKEYDSTAKVNDSLQDRGVKTVVKYKTIRLQSDTSLILAVCDSLATEYQEFIFQTKETLKAADSLVTAQQSQIGEYKVQNDALKTLVKTLEDKLDAQAKELDRFKKLAKRRGRAVEW